MPILSISASICGSSGGNPDDSRTSLGWALSSSSIQKPTLPGPVNSVVRKSPVERSSRASAATGTGQVERRQVVVSLRSQGWVDGGAGGEHPGYLAADDFLGELGVLHLFADGDPVALAQQPGEVVVGGVVGHSAHGHGALFIPCGQGDLQLPGGDLRIFEEELVEVAHAEKQQGIGVLALGGRSTAA